MKKRFKVKFNDFERLKKEVLISERRMKFSIFVLASIMAFQRKSLDYFFNWRF